MSLRTVASCHNCRIWVLRTFITSIGGSTLQVQRRAFTSPPVTPPKSHEQNDDLPTIIPDALHNTTNPSPLKSTEEASEPSSTISHSAETPPSITSQLPPTSTIPWYLQQNQPTLSQSEISPRQQLPSLPAHSPALLQPLLEHISTTLGLDDLTLLDLRQMDPPPALGSNLLMILGTTRSEKHLHVSADRLCRWLRTEHHLSPYADGLLGRNELKLKMRRLAKKKNLLSAVGASVYSATNDPEGENVDDGIRTGWVCVNIGTVEGGELPKSPEQIAREAEAPIVGFNTQVAGSKIVVQMMTEEKREALGLEKLWMGILRRNIQERNEVLLGLEGEGEEQQQLEKELLVVPEVVKVTGKNNRERGGQREKEQQSQSAEVKVEREREVSSSETATHAKSDASSQPRTMYTPFEPGQYVGRGKKDRRFQVERV